MATGIARASTLPWLPRSAVLPLLGAAILLGLKIGMLLLFGPTMMPDSGGYIAYADAILTGSFLHVDLAGQAIPIVLVRPIGYPAVIAAAKIIARGDWAWAVVLLQFAMSIWATVLVYRLARMFRLGLWASLGVAAAQATAMQFVVDQAILSDSLCGSAMTVAACILSGIVLRGRPSHLTRFLGVGALIAAGMLVRSVIEYMAIGMSPLAAAAAMVEQSRLRRWAAFGLVFLPLIMTHLAYTEWNRSRIGAAVVTTATQNALFGALIEAARYDPSIFSGSTPIDDAGRRAFKTMESRQASPPLHARADGIEISPQACILRVLGGNRIHEQLAAGGQGYEVVSNLILHHDYGWDAVRISREVTLAYLRAWWEHTPAMIRHMLQPLSETQLHQAVRPTETVRDVMLWNGGTDCDFARDREVRDGNLWMIPAVIAHRLIETISVAIFAAFILVTPYRLAREGLTAETSASTGLLCVYLVGAGLTAVVVQVEPRYLTPVVAGSIVIGAVNIAWLISRHRRRPAAKPAEELPNGAPPWTIP